MRGFFTKGVLLSRLLVAAVELVDPPGGIHELLLAGKERMALRANAHMNLRPGGLDFPDLAASANHFRRTVFRMNFLFHFAYSMFWGYIIKSDYNIHVFCKNARCSMRISDDFCKESA